MPTRELDEHGLTYTHPHTPNIDVDPTFDLEGATPWERQQIVRYWRVAIRAAERVHQTAHAALVDLYGDDIDRVGMSDPQHLLHDVANLGAALAALHQVNNGRVHRQAHETREAHEG